MVLVTRVHTRLYDFLLQDSTELIATNTSHKCCRIGNTNQPLYTAYKHYTDITISILILETPAAD